MQVCALTDCMLTEGMCRGLHAEGLAPVLCRDASWQHVHSAIQQLRAAIARLHGATRHATTEADVMELHIALDMNHFHARSMASQHS